MRINWFKGSKNIIGERVREARLRERPNITQLDLSARLGVLGFDIDRVSISKLEAGKRFVADFEVVAISKALHISVEWLLIGNEKLLSSLFDG